MTGAVHGILQAYAAGGPPSPDGFGVTSAQRAVFFHDLKGKVADFGHLADTPMPSASVIKLAVAMALYKSGFDLAKRVSIAALNRSVYCSVWEMFEHTRDVSLAEVAHAMLIISDNPATTEIARRVGMESVNALLRDLGCSSHAVMAMDFNDADADANWRGNVLTARDCSILLREIATNATYARLRHLLVHNLRNNRLAAKLPEAAQIAHKTGSISGITNDVALVTDGDPATSPIEYILVCLTGGEPAASANAAQADVSLAVYEAMMQGHAHAVPQHDIWLHKNK